MAVDGEHGAVNALHAGFDCVDEAVELVGRGVADRVGDVDGGRAGRDGRAEQLL